MEPAPSVSVAQAPAEPDIEAQLRDLNQKLFERQHRVVDPGSSRKAEDPGVGELQDAPEEEDAAEESGKGGKKSKKDSDKAAASATPAVVALRGVGRVDPPRLLTQRLLGVTASEIGLRRRRRQ